MGRQGPESDKFDPQVFDDVHPERPMDAGDATGAPSPDRYKREAAFQAWSYLATHNTTKPLPKWVAEYLQDTASKILGYLEPSGALPRDSAHAALGLVGQRWPDHHPDSVFMIIRDWMIPKAGKNKPEVSGRKAGAVRYIEEYMGNDPNVQVDTVIEWYRKGQKAYKRAKENENTEAEEDKLVDFDEAMPTRIIIRKPSRL